MFLFTYDNDKPTVQDCNLCVVKTKQTTMRYYTYVAQYRFHSFNQISENSIMKHKMDKNSQILLLRSSSLVDKKYGQKLQQLIKPLQQNKYNYRDPRFIIADPSTLPKPRLQNLISQIQHYPQYKQIFQNNNNTNHSKVKLTRLTSRILKLNELDAPQSQQFHKPNPLKPRYRHKQRGSGRRHGRQQPRARLQPIPTNVENDEIPIGATPAIFSLANQKFITEINGLLFKHNTKLYTVIAEIFTQFIPMFEWCLGIKLTQYKQLSVIIKIQDYQFNNENTITGKWHCEGRSSDYIIGVGIYYFDITDSKMLPFTKNCLEIAEQQVSSQREGNIAKININHNDCIVFKNSEEIQHRAVISAGIKDNISGNDESMMALHELIDILVEHTQPIQYDKELLINCLIWREITIENVVNKKNDMIAILEYCRFPPNRAQFTFEQIERNLIVSKHINDSNGHSNDSNNAMNGSGAGGCIDVGGNGNYNGGDMDVIKMISSKMLTFFIMDPNKKRNVRDLKFINFPWKIDIVVKHFTNYNMGLYNRIPNELIFLIKLFMFGNEKYLQKEMVEFELNVDPAKFYKIQKRIFRGHMN